MVRVNLKERSYEVVVGRGIIASLGERCLRLGLGSEAFLVCDAYVLKRSGAAFKRSLARAGFRTGVFAVPSGERSK
jgi:3-dehydroquinate synthetase